jgi:hypothetical protein
MLKFGARISLEMSFSNLELIQYVYENLYTEDLKKSASPTLQVKRILQSYETCGMTGPVQ